MFHPANSTTNLQLWVTGPPTVVVVRPMPKITFLCPPHLYRILLNVRIYANNSWNTSCCKNIPKQVIIGEKEWTAGYCADASWPKTGTSHTLGYITLIFMGWEMVPSILFCCLLLFSGTDPYVKWLCKHSWPPQVTMKF